MGFRAWCTSKRGRATLSVYTPMGTGMSWQHFEFQSTQHTHTHTAVYLTPKALKRCHLRRSLSCNGKTLWHVFLQNVWWYVCAWAALSVAYMCLVCPSTLVMCLALSGCFSRVFLNALHPRIPRVQPPLDERIFSAQPGVAAVYSVSDFLLLLLMQNTNCILCL